MRQLRLRREHATKTNISTAQYDQGESIVILPSVAVDEAVATLPELGVRQSPDLQLPQNPFDAELQQVIGEVHEYRITVLSSHGFKDFLGSPDSSTMF